VAVPVVVVEAEVTIDVRNTVTRAPVVTGVAVMLAIAVASPAVAQPSSGPDWPCPQRKVVKLSASDLQWEGEIGDIAGWRQDRAVNQLVEKLASRRTALDEAMAALDAYAGGLAPAERTAKLTVVFGALLETVNLYRGSVIDGIERFNRRQRGRAREIEAEGLRVAELRRQAAADPAKQAVYDKAVEAYDWDVRVFEDRRQNIPIACDIPPAIDGRTFELARKLRALVKPAG
jgi:hypothetical protein